MAEAGAATAEQAGGEPQPPAPPRHLLVELEPLPEIREPIAASSRIKYTCLSVSERYLALGATTGGVYCFNRVNHHRYLQVLSNKEGHVTALSFAADDNLLAVGTKSGHVIIYELNFGKAKTKPKPKRVKVMGDHKAHITALCWGPRSLHVYSGDQTGKVFMTAALTKASLLKVSGKILGSQSSILLHDDPSAVVQMSAVEDCVLVSTLSRAVLLDTTNVSTQKARFRSSGQPEAAVSTQVGSQMRDGYYGACFGPPPGAKGGSVAERVIYAARPKSRVWEARAHDGQILRTLKFKPLLACDSTALVGSSAGQVTPQAKPQSHNFPYLHVMHGVYLLAWQPQRVFVLTVLPTAGVLEWHTDISDIVDLCTVGGEIYALHDNTAVVSRLALLEPAAAAAALVDADKLPAAAQVLGAHATRLAPEEVCRVVPQDSMEAIAALDGQDPAMAAAISEYLKRCEPIYAAASAEEEAALEAAAQEDNETDPSGIITVKAAPSSPVRRGSTASSAAVSAIASLVASVNPSVSQSPETSPPPTPAELVAAPAATVPSQAAPAPASSAVIDTAVAVDTAVGAGVDTATTQEEPATARGGTTNGDSLAAAVVDDLPEIAVASSRPKERRRAKAPTIQPTAGAAASPPGDSTQPPAEREKKKKKKKKRKKKGADIAATPAPAAPEPAATVPDAAVLAPEPAATTPAPEPATVPVPAPAPATPEPAAPPAPAVEVPPQVDVGVAEASPAAAVGPEVAEATVVHDLAPPTEPPAPEPEEQPPAPEPQPPTPEPQPPGPPAAALDVVVDVSTLPSLEELAPEPEPALAAAEADEPFAAALQADSHPASGSVLSPEDDAAATAPPCDRDVPTAATLAVEQPQAPFQAAEEQAGEPIDEAQADAAQPANVELPALVTESEPAAPVDGSDAIDVLEAEVGAEVVTDTPHAETAPPEAGEPAAADATADATANATADATADATAGAAGAAETPDDMTARPTEESTKGTPPPASRVGDESETLPTQSEPPEDDTPNPGLDAARLGAGLPGIAVAAAEEEPETEPRPELVEAAVDRDLAPPEAEPTKAAVTTVPDAAVVCADGQVADAAAEDPATSAAAPVELDIGSLPVFPGMASSDSAPTADSPATATGSDGEPAPKPGLAPEERDAALVAAADAGAVAGGSGPSLTEENAGSRAEASGESQDPTPTPNPSPAGDGESRESKETQSPSRRSSLAQDRKDKGNKKSKSKRKKQKRARLASIETSPRKPLVDGGAAAGEKKVAPQQQTGATLDRPPALIESEASSAASIVLPFPELGSRTSLSVDVAPAPAAPTPAAPTPAEEAEMAGMASPPPTAPLPVTLTFDPPTMLQVAEDPTAGSLRADQLDGAALGRLAQEVGLGWLLAMPEIDKCPRDVGIELLGRCRRAKEAEAGVHEVSHDLLAQIDSYLWDKKDATHAPQVRALLAREALGCLPDGFADRAGAKARLAFDHTRPLRRSFEDAKTHFGVWVNTSDGCPACTIPLIGERVVVYPCQHAYHEDCAPEGACPICFHAQRKSLAVGRCV